MKSVLSTFVPFACIVAALLLMGTPLALPASGPAVLIGSLPHPDNIAIDGTNAYVTSYDPAESSQVTVFAVPIAGGTAQRLATLPGSPLTGIAVRAATVYFTQAGSGKVWSIPLGTLQPHPVASGQQEPWAPGSIALGETAVFWTCYDGLVRKVAKQGGKPATISSGQVRPNAIAVSSSAVVWANLGKVVGERELPGALMVLRRYAL